jgi:type II secretion system protein N
MTTLEELTARLRSVKLPALQGWRKPAGWAGLGFFLFACFLALTFPYDAVRSRIGAEADAAGLWVRMESIGPALFGVTARGVRIARRADGPEAPPPPVQIDRLTLRPSLWPWGVGFSASLFGGDASGVIGTRSAPKLRLDFHKLGLRRANIQGLTGLDADGTLGGLLELDIPASGPRGGEPDLAQASGHLRLSGTGLQIQGGTITIPLFGQMTPVDLPPVALGTLEVDAPIERGVANVKTFNLRGTDGEVQVSGTVRLARTLPYAEPDLLLRIRADPNFIRRVGIVGGGLTALPPDPTDSAFRDAKLTGYFNKPLFRPGR